MGGAVMAYNDLQLQIMEDLVKAAVKRTRATGTMVARDPDSNYGTVLFDGSSVAVPVKVLTGTWARANDRVLMDLYGSDWVVTGSFGTGEPNWDQFTWRYTVAHTTTSGSNADIPETGAGMAPFRKERSINHTVLFIRVHGSCYSQGAGQTVPTFAVRIDGTDYDVASFFINPAGTHTPFVGTTWLPMDEGFWPIQPRWRRAQGAGAVQVDEFDSFDLTVKEVPWPNVQTE